MSEQRRAQVLLQDSSPPGLPGQEAAADPGAPPVCGGPDTRCCLWKTQQRPSRQRLQLRPGRVSTPEPRGDACSWTLLKRNQLIRPADSRGLQVAAEGTLRLLLLTRSEDTLDEGQQRRGQLGAGTLQEGQKPHAVAGAPLREQQHRARTSRAHASRGPQRSPQRSLGKAGAGSASPEAEPDGAYVDGPPPTWERFLKLSSMQKRRCPKTLGDGGKS